MLSYATDGFYFGKTLVKLVERAPAPYCPDQPVVSALAPTSLGVTAFDPVQPVIAAADVIEAPSATGLQAAETSTGSLKPSPPSVKNEDAC